MKIAVTYNDGEVFQHFGHANQIKIYDIQNGQVVGDEILTPEASGHSAMVEFLKEKSVDTLICGGIGGCAKNALAQNNIRLYGGVVGKADDAVSALLSNTLKFNPEAKCSHHEESSHEGCSHHCGGHCH